MMRKIKKCLSMTLALALSLATFAFAACGEKGQNIGGSDSINSSVQDSESSLDSDSSVQDSEDSVDRDSSEDVSDSVDSSMPDSSVQDSSANGPHAHEFGDWAAVLPVTDCVGATFQRICAECGGTEEKVGTYEDHVWADEYSYDDTHHWIACGVCGVCEESQEKETHVDKGEGACEVCDMLFPTTGVAYEISDDGTYAIVTGYDGFDAFVVVASSYGGVPVTEIAEGAFQDNAVCMSVTIPDGVTDIGANAFNGCGNLEGVKIPESVVRIGENAFVGVRDLTIFCEAKSKPIGWNDNWNATERMVFWGYTGERMTMVSPRALMIGDAMLNVDEPDRRQIVINDDLGDVAEPEGFSMLTRFDSNPNGNNAWGGKTKVLEHYNFSNENLGDYSDIWFAVKMEGAFWVFQNGDWRQDITTPWVYFHIKQEYTDQFGNDYWTIEVSIGGQKIMTIENQSGKMIDKDRASNAISTLFWDEGFGSADGNMILIYALNGYERVSIYCTEILGIKMGY